MDRSCYNTILVLSFLLMLSFSHGLGRKLMGSFVHGNSARDHFIEGNSREMMELDYVDAGPNFNDQSGLFTSPPPSPSPGLGY
ncbi:Hypothetical predicted protein [Olea europaea subsp. europaea]|uniref:Uncharacterized protein n=1 Tax=Olea europaea subsp. europaea TaxID=158383 RepID=A0A8S0R7J5_OLEEU|nr:Hypothetical predicted protein [Olea europaea subsp. europaea]